MAVEEPGNREQDYRQQAVERRDKLEESFDHDERCTDRHRDRLAADHAGGDRWRPDAGARAMKGGEESEGDSNTEDRQRV